MSFTQYQFKAYINQGLTTLGFTTPTKIQSLIIPKILKNDNIIGKSATGTGKTHAFLLPILQRIKEDVTEVQNVIISPTRELAQQLFQNFQVFAQINEKLDIRLYVGGTNRDSEIKRLEKSQPQIVIATIGKLKDLAIDTNVLKIHTAKSVVIDEADMVFEANEMVEVDHIFARLSENIQILTFSATMPKDLMHFMNKYLSKCDTIDITEKKISKETIEHIFIPTKNKDKMTYLLHLLDVINPYLVLVFANTKTMVDDIAQFLGQNDVKLVKLTGDLEARERKQVLRRIKEGKIQFIVASDIASRGIDIDGISHIINFELPDDIEFYIHRSGRTARHESLGISISFYDFNDDAYLNKLEAKGLRCVYKAIKDGQLLPTKERNMRSKRSRKVTAIEEELHLKTPMPRKVKPGYKKKRNLEIKRKLQKMKRKNISEMYHKRGRKDEDRITR